MNRENEEILTSDDAFFGVLFTGEWGFFNKSLKFLLDIPLFICSHMASTRAFTSIKTGENNRPSHQRTDVIVLMW